MSDHEHQIQHLWERIEWLRDRAHTMANRGWWRGFVFGSVLVNGVWCAFTLIRISR